MRICPFTESMHTHTSRSAVEQAGAFVHQVERGTYIDIREVLHQERTQEAKHTHRSYTNIQTQNGDQEPGKLWSQFLAGLASGTRGIQRTRVLHTNTIHRRGSHEASNRVSHTRVRPQQAQLLWVRPWPARALWHTFTLNGTTFSILSSHLLSFSVPVAGIKSSQSHTRAPTQAQPIWVRP